MKKLRQKYRTEKDKAKKSGNGRGKKWQYFEKMDRFLATRHNVEPIALVDTMAKSSTKKTEHNSQNPSDDEDIGN